MAQAQNSADTRDIAGWYGKLSALGDFAQRRLPAECVSACDAWLSGVMQAGRAELGDGWLDIYLTAPVLRFAWAPGVIDTRWWFGVLMPSCDSVGRYFPLLIAQPRLRPPEDRIALDHLELWYEHVAQTAVLTLNDGPGSVDALEAALEDAPPWPTSGRVPALAAPPPIAPADGHLALKRGATLTHWLHALAAEGLTARLTGSSVWWRVSESGDDASVDIVAGLPDGSRFVTLLGGGEPAFR